MLLKLSFDEFRSATYFSMNSFNSKEFLHFLTSLIFNMPSPHFWRASATALSIVLERGLSIFKSLHWSSKSKPFRVQTVNAASQRRTFLASYVRSMPNKARRALDLNDWMTSRTIPRISFCLKLQPTVLTSAVLCSTIFSVSFTHSFSFLARALN